jgi:hypothetical protein
VFSSSDAKVAHLVGCYFLGIWILTNFGLWFTLAMLVF